LSHALLDAKIMQKEIDQMDSVPISMKLPAPKAAFSNYVRFIVNWLLDAEFVTWVHQNPAALASYMPCIEAMEKTFNARIDQWVYSSSWEQSGRGRFFKDLTQLPYVSSLYVEEPLRDCQICSRRHGATYKISLFGCRYYNSAIREMAKRPITERELILDPDYKSYEFYCGDLCHQRIRLYHSMLHWKLHLILIIRGLLNSIVDQLIQRGEDWRSDQNLVVEGFMTCKDYPHFERTFFGQWSRLDELSNQYGEKDTRCVRINYSELDNFVNFDKEECITELFSLRSPSQCQNQPPSSLSKPRIRPINIDSDNDLVILVNDRITEHDKNGRHSITSRHQSRPQDAAEDTQSRIEVDGVDSNEHEPINLEGELKTSIENNDAKCALIISMARDMTKQDCQTLCENMGDEMRNYMTKYLKRHF